MINHYWWEDEKRPLTDDDFTNWLKENVASVNTSVERVWNNDRYETIIALCKMWKAVRDVGRRETAKVQAKLDAVNMVLVARAPTVINFSLFGKKS